MSKGKLYTIGHRDIVAIPLLHNELDKAKKDFIETYNYDETHGYIIDWFKKWFGDVNG
jgi:hypothetical protein